MTALMGVAAFGAAVVLVGTLIYLFLGFTQRIWWGLAILLLPYAELLFTYFHWDRSRLPFWLYVVGHIAFLGAAYGGATEQLQDLAYEDKAEAFYRAEQRNPEQTTANFIEYLNKFRLGKFEPKPGATTPAERRAQKLAEQEKRNEEAEAAHNAQLKEMERQRKIKEQEIMANRAEFEAEMKARGAAQDEARKKRAQSSREAIIQKSKSVDWHQQ